MSEIVNAEENSLSVIDGLAQQARALRLSIEMNMWELARVFVEAKELVPHGEWGKWLEENAQVDVRTAQDMMAAYRRYGDRPQFATLGRTKVFKLLALPEGTEDRFASEHDLSAMSTREVQEAVRMAREEARNELEKERAARRDAERRAEEAENRPGEIPPELTQELQEGRRLIEVQKAEITRLTQIGQESIDEKNRLTRENSTLRQEMEEQSAMLFDQQEELNRTQAELLNARSAIARGDAERAPAEQLTAEIFGKAVRNFLGQVARMPQMRTSFSRMQAEEIEEYDLLLRTVEDWCRGSRRAIDTVAAEGGVVR